MNDLTQSELTQQFSELSEEAFQNIYPPNLTEDARRIYYAEKAKRDIALAKDVGQENQQAPSVDSQPEGIRRLPYWLGVIGISILFSLFRALGSQDIVMAGLVISIGLLIVLTVKRLQNMGASGLWSLLLLVPIVNLITVVFCGLIPEGDFRAKAQLPYNEKERA